MANEGLDRKTKGHPINWARVVVVTTKKKAQHVSIGSLLKGPFANSSDCNDKCEKQGMTFQSHKNLDLDAFIYEEQNLIIVFAIVEEIKGVENLLDFKHDMRKISRVCTKALEWKKFIKEHLVRLW